MYSGAHIYGWRSGRPRMALGLHLIKFFNYHLRNKGESTLAHIYADLDDRYKPQLWEGKLTSEGAPLGHFWLGTYGGFPTIFLNICLPFGVEAYSS